VTPKEKLLDDRYSESIVLATPGGYVGRSKYDSAAQYPIQDGDIKATFENLYPMRPNFNMYTECSSRGTCDYATGQCKCFDGFEGRGCRRTTCPNSCSGHGRCLSNQDKNSQYTSYNYPNDQMWDQARTQVCMCDRGYTGFDCNSRICPFGDDPTSDCGENSAGDVQLVVTKSPVDANTNYFFTLTFTDMFGGKFTTRPILDQACPLNAGDTPNECEEVQYALMDLPNFAIPEVEVDILEIVEDSTGTTTKTSLYTVQFTDSSNSGKQNTLECNLIADSNVAGAQPKYLKTTECQVFNVGAPEWFADDGQANTLDLSHILSSLGSKSMTDILPGSTATASTTYEDFQPCSSKGDCDAATGTCTCNAGHYGEACEKQSTYY